VPRFTPEWLEDPSRRREHKETFMTLKLGIRTAAITLALGALGATAALAQGTPNGGLPPKEVMLSEPFVQKFDVPVMKDERTENRIAILRKQLAEVERAKEAAERRADLEAARAAQAEERVHDLEAQLGPLVTRVQKAEHEAANGALERQRLEGVISDAEEKMLELEQILRESHARTR
jgi:hypothetical protein